MRPIEKVIQTLNKFPIDELLELDGMVYAELYRRTHDPKEQAKRLRAEAERKRKAAKKQIR